MSESLITKLEQASEGSRELDAAIWETQGYVRKKSRKWHIPTTPEKIYVDTWRTPSGKEIAPFYEDGGIDPDDIPPHFTTSLDCALTLVPEGWGWLVEVWQREESWAQVVCRPKGSTKPSGIFEGAEAKSPALALCIAALKAVASLKARAA